MSQLFTQLASKELVALLHHDAVGVLPTDTVYGLVARAHSVAAVEKLYTIKPREQLPGTFIAASVDDLVALGFDHRECLLAARYWPGRVSVVLDAYRVAPYLKRTRQSLAVRIPDNPALIALLKATGPLITTSANSHNQPTAETITDARRYFGDSIDFYVDAGVLPGNHPSKIIGFAADGSLIVYRDTT